MIRSNAPEIASQTTIRMVRSRGSRPRIESSRRSASPFTWTLPAGLGAACADGCGARISRHPETLTVWAVPSALPASPEWTGSGAWTATRESSGRQESVASRFSDGRYGIVIAVVRRSPGASTQPAQRVDRQVLGPLEESAGELPSRHRPGVGGAVSVASSAASPWACACSPNQCCQGARVGQREGGVPRCP